MIYSAEAYAAMKNAVLAAISENRSVTFAESVKLGIDFDAITSLYSQQFVRNLKSGSKKLNDKKVQSILQRVSMGESLLDISKEFKLGTYKIARVYIEATLGKNFQISNIVTNPMVIEDERIRMELLKMLEIDPICSHEIDIKKECLGREYEELLISLLNKRHMCFETEAELRSRGKPKTPDILFLIPMAVYASECDSFMTDQDDPGIGMDTKNTRDAYSAHSPVFSGRQGRRQLDREGERDRFVINWIDSKAMFADDLTFTEQLEQFHAYNNRYGRGMVIYWHGVAESVYGKMFSDDMIIVRDSFPTEWIFPTGEPADGRVPQFDLVDL